MTLEAMNYIARYLAGIPGRKNLIWFSGSFPISVFPTGKDKQQTDTMRQYGPAIRKTADLLTLSKVAVYPVGAEGVINEHLMEASNAGPTNTEGATPDNRMGGSTSQRQPDPDGPLRRRTFRPRRQDCAMEQLAADTGGEAILNANDLNKAIARAVQNGSHYYTSSTRPPIKTWTANIAASKSSSTAASTNSLTAEAITPTRPRKTPQRDILIHPKTRYQRRSAAPDARARNAQRNSVALWCSRAPRHSPASLDCAPRRGNTNLTGPLTRYSVDFLIRWTDVDLQLTPQGNHGGRIQLGVIAYGRDGKPVNWVGVTQNMNINPATFAAIQRSGIPAHLEIDLPQQDVYLATGVYDWASQKAGTLEIPLNLLQAQASSAPQKQSPTKPN